MVEIVSKYTKINYPNLNIYYDISNLSVYAFLEEYLTTSVKQRAI